LITVALYARVSTEDQAKEGFSLDAQQERLRAYCKAREWKIAGEYIDEGHSGRNVKRPAYQKMMQEKDKWDAILVIKMDRIHRNARNFMEMMDDLKKWEKDFVSATESLDTSTAMGRFVMDIIQRIAQLESEQIGERVQMGMKQKAKSGEGILGSPIPYGYRLKENKYVIIENEAEIIREIFRRYCDDESFEDIRRNFKKKGLLTRGGKPWSKMSLAHIIHNPVYTGMLRWADVLRENYHPAIIDIDTFKEAQKISESRKRKQILAKPSTSSDEVVMGQQRKGQAIQEA